MALTKVTGQVIKNTTDVTVGVLTVTNTLAVGGTVSIGGTLTYEDVTNVDAVGLITARDGIKVGSGITLSVDGDGFFTGVITATSYSGIDLSAVTGATGDFSIADKIVHTGDTNTAIRFPADDTVTAETGGSERLRITSDGKIGINETSPGQRLHVGGDIQIGFNTPNDAARQINFNVNRGSAADTLANINWQWNDKFVAQIRGIAGADTTNKDDAHLAFFTSSANNLSERARITSAGHFGVGVDPADSFSFGKAIDSGSATGAFYYARDTDGGSDAVGGFGYSGSALYIGNEKSDGYIRFSTNTSATERMRIDSAGRVLIGTTTEGWTGYDELTIATSGDTGITLRSGTSSSGQIAFADGTSGDAEYRGIIRYGHSDDDFFFCTNGDTTRMKVASDIIETGSKTITGGDNLAIQGFAVKGVYSGTGSVGKSIELISGYDSSVKMAALGYNLTDTSLGSTYGGDLTFHTQPLYSSPTTPLPERMRISSSGYVTIPQQPAFSVYINGFTSESQNSGTQTMPFNTANTNIGGHFKTSGTDQYKFVAPVAGQYFFSLSQNHNSRVDTRILKNGTTFHGGENEIPMDETDGQWHHHTLTCVMTLAVGDKVHCTTNNQDGGSTYRAWNGGYWDNFSGFLIG